MEVQLEELRGNEEAMKKLEAAVERHTRHAAEARRARGSAHILRNIRDYKPGGEERREARRQELTRKANPDPNPFPFPNSIPNPIPSRSPSRSPSPNPEQEFKRKAAASREAATERQLAMRSAQLAEAHAYGDPRDWTRLGLGLGLGLGFRGGLGLG